MWGETAFVNPARRARKRSNFQNACLVSEIPRRETKSTREGRCLSSCGLMTWTYSARSRCAGAPIGTMRCLDPLPVTRR